MTLKYAQEHAKGYHAHPKEHAAHSGELHLEHGELYLGEKPTGIVVEDEPFSPRKLVLGLVATALFFVTDKLAIHI
jgi:hypothetical protein